MGGGIDPRHSLASGTVAAPARGFKLLNRPAADDGWARHERCGMVPHSYMAGVSERLEHVVTEPMSE